MEAAIPSAAEISGSANPWLNGRKVRITRITHLGCFEAVFADQLPEETKRSAGPQHYGHGSSEAEAISALIRDWFSTVRRAEQPAVGPDISFQR